MKQTRSLALRSERLAELTSHEMRAVNGGVRTVFECIDLSGGCIQIHDPSDRFVSVCDGCLTNQNCRTLFC